MGPKQGGRFGWYYAIYLLALSAWIFMILLAPLAKSKDLEPLSRSIYSIFSWVCHQKDERCFHIYGEPLAVCARCTFIYLGVFLASSIYPLLGSPRIPRVRYLIIAALPLVADAGTQLVGIRESTNLLRATTGLVFGMALAFYIAPEAEHTVSIVIARMRGGAASLHQRA